MAFIKSILSTGTMGVYFLHQGLKDYKLYRLIEDIPTSNIKTAAVGHHVEIKGEIIPPNHEEIIAPLSKEKCAYFIWQVERYISGKNSRWVPHHCTFSSSYLYVKDSSDCYAGISLKDVSGSIGEHKEVMHFKNPSELPEVMRDYFSKRQFRSWFKAAKGAWGLMADRYRVREVVVYSHTPLYAIGYADGRKKMTPLKFDKYQSYHDRILPISVLEELSPQELFEFHRLSFLEMQKKNKFVLKSTVEEKWRLFGLNQVYLSQKSEDDFVFVGRNWAFLKTSGGIVLCVLCAVLILFQFFR